MKKFNPIKMVICFVFICILFGGCNEKDTEKNRQNDDTVKAEQTESKTDLTDESYQIALLKWKEHIGRNAGSNPESDESTTIDFGKDTFEFRGTANHKGNNLLYLKYNGEYEIPIKPEIYCDLIEFKKLSDTLFEIKPSELGAEEVYTFDTETKELTFISRRTDMHVH